MQNYMEDKVLSPMSECRLYNSKHISTVIFHSIYFLCFVCLNCNMFQRNKINYETHGIMLTRSTSEWQPMPKRRQVKKQQCSTIRRKHIKHDIQKRSASRCLSSKDRRTHTHTNSSRYPHTTITTTCNSNAEVESFLSFLYYKMPFIP